MTKAQDWKKITYLRKTIKDRKTAVMKDRHGNPSGGVILTNETIKPYLAKLADLEAKLAKDKEQMSTGERVDTAADEIKANNDHKNQNS